jgi:dsRNA-specific ribonuclease
MLNFHSGARFQQGRGIGSFFGALFRMLKPVAKMGLSVGKKFIKSDFAKSLASTALDVGKSAATNIAVDLLEGKKFSDTAQDQLDDAKSKIAATLKGGGCRKRKKKTISNIPAKYSIFN